MAKKKIVAKPELRLQSKGTDALNKSVAADMQFPDRPLTMKELQKLNKKGDQAISWLSQDETNSQEEIDAKIKAEIEAEMDAIDEEVD